MSQQFFNQPILNSPYECPSQHWELDDTGQPTQTVLLKRRPAKYISPVPPVRRQQDPARNQTSMVFDSTARKIETENQQYDLTETIESVRHYVGNWRALPKEKWRVTPETARLLQHWRSRKSDGFRLFFCQVEAAETIIWLTEVAPGMGNAGKQFLEYLNAVNEKANPGLPRLALKLATGAGKTAVMAMLIAWQTINAVRRPNSQRFTRGFLVVTPGITIKDRLRVLQPNDPDSYYRSRELVPTDMLADLNKARIVITNYHAFKLRDRLELSKGGRALLQGRGLKPLAVQETQGQMLQRVMPELMGMKNVMALNDEAHHCYREKTKENHERRPGNEDQEEARKNKETARLWISGLEAVRHKLGLNRVVDLSATPFFLRGSGDEGTLFPWTMSDFSLMDAIECGIVKVPRVPVADNVQDTEIPKLRVLWNHIGGEMPTRPQQNATLDSLRIPTLLDTALNALYGYYEKTFEAWQNANINVPPCFIIVCNNTATSKLVHDYISGFHRTNNDGTKTLENGRLPLFRNFDEQGNPFPRPRTLLIDSRQLESDEPLGKEFRSAAADQILQLRLNRPQTEKINDQDLLREVMNTVGKPGRLGDSVRCVVSVSMLTEGWDANTVTHVLGVRAFSTQLLCEQVVGRALRRQSYDLDENGLFRVEYADVLGIPFDFTAKPVVASPTPPRETIQVKAVHPERDHLEIRFPCVAGYRVELPEERLDADFNEDSVLELTPELTGPTETRNEGIIGEGVNLDLTRTEGRRSSTLLFHLAKQLLYTKWRDLNEDPKLHLFGQLKRITKQWLDTCLVCKGGTFPAQLISPELADFACERIAAAITRAEIGNRPVKAVLDPYNPVGSTQHVNFNTTKTHRHKTDPRRCHVNWAILDSTWEGEFCRVIETHPNVRAYVKNQNLGLEVPYRSGSTARTYVPDFIVVLDDGSNDPTYLVAEIKGYRGEDAKDKKAAMETYWVPGVNYHGCYGRWAFAEFTDVYDMQAEFAAKVEALLDDSTK